MAKEKQELFKRNKMNKVCKDIKKYMGEQFVCFPFNEFIKIRTPYFYPDGDVVDIFFKYKDSGFLVTDLGEAVRCLLTQSISSSLNKKKDKLIQNILINYHVERYKGMLIRRALNIEDLSIAVFDLSQAIVRVGGIY